jgi:hypothetical protein
MSRSEHYEQLLAFISTHMPVPFSQEDADDAVVFTGGSPGEVIVRLTDREVIVEEYAVRWETPFTPVLRPRRIGLVKWRRLKESHLMTIVGELIKAARNSRRSRYRPCGACGKVVPPESMADTTTCQRCHQRVAALVH